MTFFLVFISLGWVRVDSPETDESVRNTLESPMIMPETLNSTELAAPPKVLAAAAHGVEEVFFRNGGDVDSIFGNAGIRAADLCDPLREINLKQYCDMFEIAARQTGNPNVGLHFGQSFQPQHLGMLGYAAISSPTLAAGLRNMELFFPAHQGLSNFGMIQDDGILWLFYHVLDPRVQNRRQDAELSLGMFCNIFRTALGPHWHPIEVRFEHERQEGLEEYGQAFGCPVLFGRRTNAIGFRRSALYTHMPTRDPYLFSIVSAYLRSRIARMSDVEDFATIIRDQVKMQLGSAVLDIDSISTTIGLTSPKLKKQLKQNGLTFKAVVRAAREELALHYLEDVNMPLTEVAFNLGYSELSAFSRAFRNWTGMNPQKFRHNLKGKVNAGQCAC